MSRGTADLKIFLGALGLIVLLPAVTLLIVAVATHRPAVDTIPLSAFAIMGAILTLHIPKEGMQ